MANGYMPASRARAHFTRARLLEIFEYQPNSGRLIFRDTQKEVVGRNNHGYTWACVDGALLLAHRVAWRIMTGEWPRMIDHINGVRYDNRWANLRETDNSLNAQNYTKAMRTSTTGLLGVSIDKRRSRNRFRAAIRVDGVHFHLGSFDTAEAAHAAYLKAKAIYHPTAFISGSGDELEAQP